MSNNFTVFESAVSALGANSQALSIASQNIANVNTPGYSRQTIVLQSRAPQTSGGHEIGRGVEVADVKRVYDLFIELRLRQGQEIKSNEEAKSQILQQVESIFNEISQDGLGKFTNEFFNAFHEVANDPNSTSARLNLLSKADVIVDRFHSLSTKLEDAKELIDGDISNNVTEINSIVAEIADLNVKIRAAGEGADLTFRDQRNMKVRELAEYVDVNAIDTSEGVFQVYIAQGVPIVNGASYSTLTTQADVNNDNHYNVYFVSGNSETDITTRINGGALKGLIDARDTNITNYADQLDEMAYTMVQQVNDLHTNGYDLNGNTLVEFFDEDVLTSDEAVSATLATDLKDGNGAHLRIKSGDTITVAGTIGAPFSSTFAVSATTTLGDIASSLQAKIRAAGAGTETVTVQADGSLRVTAGATAISGLTMSITGKSAFNTAFTFTTPIAIAGTGSSDNLNAASTLHAASLIDLDSAVDGTPKAIAASASAGDLPGGNSIAISLANLQGSLLSFSSGSTTFAGFYGDLLAGIGSDSKSSQNKSEFAQSVFNQAELQRERISGVSLEEEQLSLIKYQTAFQAASRLVSVAADILKTLVELGA